MNVGAHQEKDKKTGKRKAGVERRQETDFKETVCCLFTVVQGVALQKNGLCWRSARGNWDPKEGQQPWGWGPHHHVEAAVDWCSSILLALYTEHTTEISHFTFQQN